MEDKGLNISELSIFDEILNGRLRPFLPEYSSWQNLSKLVVPYKADSGFKDCEILPVDKHILSGEDFLISEMLVDNSVDQNQKKLADYKIECFTTIMSRAFESIMRRAINLGEGAKDEKEKSSVVDQHVEVVNKLVALSKKVKSSMENGEKEWDDPDTFIIDMARFFLLRSIVMYEKEFSWISKNTLSEDARNDYHYLEDKMEGIESLSSYFNPKNPDRYRIFGNSKIQKNNKCFSLKGDYWEITFNGKETTIRNLDKIRYIVMLLEKPNENFDCGKLYSLVRGRDPEIDQSMSTGCGSLNSQRMNQMEQYDNEFSRSNISTAVKAAEELWLRANNPDVSEEDREEEQKNWEIAKEYFQKNYGLTFRKARSGKIIPVKRNRLRNNFEKVRVNVKKQITNGINDISKKIFSFAVYLKKHITTGRICVYRPDPNEEEWVVNWGDR